jgi:hypothetical protein
MIDLKSETLITFAAAARVFPPGRRGRPGHASTIYRWAVHGVRGHRLEFVRLGRMYTSLQRFADRLTADAQPATPPARHSAAPGSAGVDAELDAAGL